MPVLRLTVPGANFSGVGLGKLIPLPDVRTSLYAAYVFGTTYGVSSAKDLAGYGRDASISGGTTNTASWTGTGGGYIQLPFSFSQLGSANNEGTIVLLAKGSSAHADMLAGTYYAGGNFTQLMSRVVSPSGAQLYTYGASGSIFTPVGDSYLGTGYEMFAGAMALDSQLVYVSHGNITALTATGAKAIAAIGDTNLVRLGGVFTDGTFNNSDPEIVSALFYNKKLTIAEIDSIKTSLQSTFAGYGITL